MRLRSTLLAVVIIISHIAGSKIPLVAVAPRRLLMLPFALYVIRWSHACVGILLAVKAVLTASTISAVSLQFSASAPALQKRRISLSISVGALTGPGNCAAAVLSWAMRHPTVVVRILQLTVYHWCSGIMLARNAATFTMLGRTWRFWCLRVGVC